MWNAKADGLQTSVFLSHTEITQDDILLAQQHAYELRSKAFADMTHALVSSVKGWFAARRNRRALLELDNHVLEDIGLTRYQVYDAYRAPSFGAAGFFVPLIKLVVGFVEFVNGWQARRDAYQQLSGLDDHMLEDIGVRRNEIEAIAFRGKVRKPIMHAPVSVDTLRTHAFPGAAPEKRGKHLAA